MRTLSMLTAALGLTTCSLAAAADTGAGPNDAPPALRLANIFGDSMVLMQVSDISTPEPGDGTADISDIRNNLAETAGDDLIASLVIALQEKYQVEVNYGLIDQMLSPGTGG